ncbi:MAG: hypothetical protein IBX68_12710 [Dehalococcoidia bacterium]|nr:hypothetical protein [Dehalococcoidia bacterium]
MSERRRGEKDEKSEEKKREKEEEKGRGVEEKWRRDRITALIWAGVLVWAALVLLAETTGYADRFDWWSPWAVFLAGWGFIVLLGAMFRLLIPEHRTPVTGSLILGFVLLGIGMGGLVGWGYVWPVVLIIVALLILIRAFGGRKRM